jgi:CubicO group peptidase (beta-lactamase class C family)
MTEVLSELEAYAAEARGAEGIPGMSYAVVKDDAVVFSKALGERKAGEAAPVTTSTLFEIGSTSKAFTAALLGMAVEDGLLSWDTRVVDVLPRFRMHDPWVTREMRIADLVSQRSGMPPYSLDWMAFIGFGRDEIQQALVHVEPVSSFRNTFGYVNTLWLVAAEVLEKVTGHRWEDAVHLRVLGPLGMRETTVDPEVVGMAGDVAAGHLRQADGGLRPIPPDWPFRGWLDTYGPAGSIRSTVLDMTRWARLHLARGTFEGEPYLAPGTVDLLHAPRTLAYARDGSSGSYAMGWLSESRRAGRIVWHNGGTSGQHSIVALYPAANAALVVLTNSSDNQVPERMMGKLFDLLFTPPAPTLARRAQFVAEEKSLPPFRIAAAPKPALLAPLPSLPLARYVGAYENPAYGRFAVTEKGGGLVMTMGPWKIEGVLTHYSGNVWVLSFPNYPEMAAGVTFSVPTGRPAERLVVDICADAGGGIFGRVDH